MDNNLIVALITGLATIFAAAIAAGWNPWKTHPIDPPSKRKANEYKRVSYHNLVAFPPNSPELKAMQLLHKSSFEHCDGWEVNMATYYDLVIRCPACIAKGENGGLPSQWYHANCGGKIQIGEDANFKCVSCGDKWHIRNSRYAHIGHESDYRPTTAAHFASVIATAGQITGTAGKRWLMTLLENMGGDDW